jgi:hypothetical protein
VGITEPIVRFWFDRALSTDVYRRLNDAVKLPDAGDDERVRGLMTASLLALAGGHLAEAHRSSSLAVDAARAADVGRVLALGLSVRAQAGAASGLSTGEQVHGDVAEAVEHASVRRCSDTSLRTGDGRMDTGEKQHDRCRVPPT